MVILREGGWYGMDQRSSGNDDEQFLGTGHEDAGILSRGGCLRNDRQGLSLGLKV